MHRIAHAVFALVFLGASSASWAANDATPPGPHESEKSAAGAKAADDHWLRAELTGDTDFLSQLLLPGYRSVDGHGVAISREHIIAGAVKYKNNDKGKEEFAAWQKANPTETAVALHGDIAVVSFYDPALGPDKGVRSSDVLIYENGGWHALYSQHSMAVAR